MFLKKDVRVNQNTFCVQEYFSENRTVYEIMWKNKAQSCRPQMTIWRMRIAFWIPKATNTHSVCVILVSFPLQQWLNERVSMLRYTYIAYRVSSIVVFTTQYGLCL